MTSAGGSPAKTCVSCGIDCSGMPRTKDKHGRYWCKPCYVKAIKKLKARRAREAAAKAAVAPVAAAPAGGVDDLMALGSGQSLEPERSRQPQCPGCAAPMPPGAATCKACGYSRLQAPAAAVAATARSTGISAPSLGGVAGVLGNPWVIFLGITGVFAALFFLGRTSPELAMVFVLVNFVFCLGVGIWMLVSAFRESVGTGFLCLCVPFYALYFVFAKSDSVHLKAAYGAGILSNIMAYSLPFGAFEM